MNDMVAMMVEGGEVRREEKDGAGGKVEDEDEEEEERDEAPGKKGEEEEVEELVMMVVGEETHVEAELMGHIVPALRMPPFLRAFLARKNRTRPWSPGLSSTVVSKGQIEARKEILVPFPLAVALTGGKSLTRLLVLVERKEAMPLAMGAPVTSRNSMKPLLASGVIGRRMKELSSTAFDRQETEEDVTEGLVAVALAGSLEAGERMGMRRKEEGGALRGVRERSPRGSRSDSIEEERTRNDVPSAHAEMRKRRRGRHVVSTEEVMVWRGPEEVALLKTEVDLAAEGKRRGLFGGPLPTQRVVTKEEEEELSEVGKEGEVVEAVVVASTSQTSLSLGAERNGASRGPLIPALISGLPLVTEECDHPATHP